MIDIEKLIQSNIEYSKDKLFGGTATGLGNKNQRFYYPNAPWNYADKKKAEEHFDEVDTKDFERSHWLLFRTYYKDTGILIIYFNPIETYGKPPIVLGVDGPPIPPAFVKALDEGIYSSFYGYDGSSGAFFKKYIQQYMWNDAIKDYIENPTKVVNAVTLEELEEARPKIEKLKKSKDPLENMVAEQLMTPSQKFRHMLVDNSTIKKYANEYVKNKIGKFAKEKLGLNLADIGVSKYIDKLGAKIIPEKLLAQVNGTNKAITSLTREINRKGLGQLARSGGRKTLATNAKRAIGSEVAVGEAGIAAAPETAGLSLLIAAGITITSTMKKNQSTIKKVSGNEGMDIIQILAFKKLLGGEIKRELKREYVDNGFNNLIGAAKDQFKQLNELSKRESQGNHSVGAFEKWNGGVQDRFYRPGSSNSYKSPKGALKAHKRANTK